MIIFTVIEVLASSAETFLGISLPAMIQGNHKLKIKETCIALLFLTALVKILNHYTLFSFFTSLVGVFSMSLSTCIIYRTSFANTSILTAIFMLVVYANDFLLLSVVGVLSKNPDFASTIAQGISFQRSCFLVLAKLSLGIVCWMFIKYYRSANKKYFALWGILLLITGVIGYFVNSTLAQTDFDSLLTWFLLFLLIFVIIFSSIQHLLAKLEAEKNLIEKERFQMLSDNYYMFMKNYQEHQIFYHDLKNQYLIIKNHLENNEYEKAKTFIDQLDLASKSAPIIRYTEIEELDTILTYKINIARRYNILVSVTAEPIHLKTTTAETVALIGNMLDNAIEASKKSETKDCWIQIIIRKINSMSFIKISNSYVHTPQVENERFLTLKNNDHPHGFGIESIKKIVEKHGGTHSISYDKGVFCITISFFD